MTDEELSTAIREVQERARARTPQGSLGMEGVNAPDLMALVHARDAAEAKVAAIGTVNPRRAGVVSSAIQGVKRIVARALNWHVREQVEFNRAAMECVQATLDALTEVNRAMSVMAGHVDARKEFFEGVQKWQGELEAKTTAGEIYTLRAVSELQASYQHRLTLQDESFRKALQGQHREFKAELALNTEQVQKRLWEDFLKVRQEYDRLIHQELRLLRQKPTMDGAGSSTANVALTAMASADPPLNVNWIKFADRFRGSEDRILAQQAMYLERFAGVSGSILDIGCGRGEFLAAAVGADLLAHGIDLDADNIAACKARGLDAEQGDVFAYLEQQHDGSLAGVRCAQVVEHLAPSAVARLVELLGAKLRAGALVAIETPNPECLAIFATHFFIDPTHTRPVPAALLHYYLQEAGFGGIEVEYLEPAVESMPELAQLPAAVRDKFFGALDYAIFARKL